MNFGAVLVVGLGEVGWSIGQALGNGNLSETRIGFDFERGTARAAREAGVVDRITSKPNSVAAEVDLTILCLPVGLVETAMEDLGPHLKTGSIVINTAPSAALPRMWAEQFFEGRQEFLNATPFGGPGLLEGGEASGGRSFVDGFLAVAPSRETSEEAIQIAVAIGEALGTSPLFVEADEFDAMTAASEGLPSLLALALLRHLTDSPGWRDIRKTAGANFYHSTQPANGHPFLLAAGLSMNRNHLLPRLDSLMNDLSELRALLVEADLESLENEIDRLQRTRQSWLNTVAIGDRETIDIPSQQPPRRGFLRSLLGMGPENQKE